MLKLQYQNNNAGNDWVVIRHLTTTKTDKELIVMSNQSVAKNSRNCQELKPDLTQKRLKEILVYNPETGVFGWSMSRSGVKKGTNAGCDRGDGYIIIKIDYTLYLAHRLAWLYQNGSFPSGDIDHINRSRSDNRISNLREISNKCNAKNCKISKNNKSGVTGVTFYKPQKKWHARIKVNFEEFHLGYFKEFHKAVSARWEAEKKYGFSDYNKTSSSFLYLKERRLPC